MHLVPPGCWSCGALASEDDLRLRVVLQPREPADGGPYTRLQCASCGVDTVVEPVTGGEPVLAPPEAVGVTMPRVALALDGARSREERRRARAWVDRHGPALEALREVRRRAPPPPAPTPPPRADRGRRERGASSPPPPRPRPRPPGTVRDLPRSPEEAREILGVAEDATREEVDDAFRRACLRCHPDLVAHLDEDFHRLAHEKFLRLKRAQEILSPDRGERAAK